MKSFKQLRTELSEKAEERYCPGCEKWETRSVCRFGVDYWDKYAIKNFKESILGESAWTRKEGKKKSGGLNEKGRKSYERENPGSDLKAPQPEGGPRKRSFCARMGGMKGPMKDENGKPTRKALALRKWKC